jgi:hypothetical protein
MRKECRFTCVVLCGGIFIKRFIPIIFKKNIPGMDEK